MILKAQTPIFRPKNGLRKQKVYISKVKKINFLKKINAKRNNKIIFKV